MMKFFKKAAALLMAGFMAVLTIAPIRAAENVDAMHRLYNPNSGEHFYTKSAAERDYLVDRGWMSEGVGWVAPSWSSAPVYRLYNPNAGDHHYTMNAGERDYLVRIGWRDEGIGWYSDTSHRTPIYRQYNPNARTGTHNYTPNKGENDHLASIGWKAEGIGWYAVTKPIGFFSVPGAKCTANAVTYRAENFTPTDYYGKTMPKNTADLIYLCGSKGIAQFEYGRYWEVPANGSYSRMMGTVMVLNTDLGLFGSSTPKETTRGNLVVKADGREIMRKNDINLYTRSFNIDLNVRGARTLQLVFENATNTSDRLVLAFQNLLLY